MNVINYVSTSPDFHWIVDHDVALGNVAAGANFDTLKKAGIDAVVVALPSMPRPKLEYVRNNVSYLHIPALDHPQQNLDKFFDLVYDFIEAHRTANKRVLVHCHAGISRSATLLASFLMRRFGMSHDQAVKYLQSKRPIVMPNPGFMNQLKTFDQHKMQPPKVNTGLDKLLKPNVVVN